MAASPASRAADRVHQREPRIHGYAAEQGSLLVAADRIDVAAHGRAVQKEMEHDTDHEHHQHRRRDVDDLSGAQPPETLREAGDRKAAGNHQREAARHIHHAQRGYEWMRQAKLGQHQSVDTSQGRSHGDGSQRGQPAGNARSQHDGRNHAGEAQDGSDGEVDSGRHDHQQLTQRQQGVDRRLAENVHQVVECQKVIGEGGQNGAHGQQRQHGAQTAEHP